MTTYHLAVCAMFLPLVVLLGLCIWNIILDDDGKVDWKMALIVAALGAMFLSVGWGAWYAANHEPKSAPIEGERTR